MTPFTWKTSIANMVMRAASLGGRLFLSLYLARELGLEAVGLFGIVTGVAGFAPALLGLGISYFVNRELLHLSTEDAYRLIRDRLALNICMAAIGWALFAGAVAAGLIRPQPHLWLIATIVTIEYLSFDLHIMLINLGRPVTANFLLFVRSASWILPVIILGLLYPALRSMDFMFHCWLAALVVNVGWIAFIFRDADFHALVRTPVHWRAMFARARKAPLLYLNDLASNGQVYLDRFIVLHFAGIKATGLYVLIFSITHGIYILVATAVTQLSMAKMAVGLREGGLATWRAILLSDARHALALAATVVVPIVLILIFVLPVFDFSIFRDNVPMLVLMATTSLLKPMSDLLNSALYSLGLDRALAMVNLAGVMIAAGLGTLFILIFGLAGIAIGSIATLVAVITIRISIISRRVKTAPLRPAA